MTEPIRRRRLWVFTQDLLFSSRIASIAETERIEYRRIQDDELADLDADGGLLLLDLDAGESQIAAAVSAARKHDQSLWFLCGYGAHVDREGLRAMQIAGADLVLSRSRLLGRLNTILTDLFPQKS